MSRVIVLVFGGIGAIGIGCGTARNELMTAEQVFADAKLLSMAKAAEVGDITTIEGLLAQGVDLNGKGRNNATVLSRAFLAKNRQAYLFLLKQGADPNVIDSRGIGVMNTAALESDAFWLEAALQYGGNTNLKSQGNSLGTVTPIFFAISESRIENVRLLVQSGADINFLTDTGYCPVTYAARNQDFGIVLYLLQAGADYQLKNRVGQSLFDYVNQSESFVKKSQLENYRAVQRFVSDMESVKKRVNQ